jgi:hypothetical protein
MIRFLEVYPGVLAVAVPRAEKRSLDAMFLRFQEYYESPEKQFRGQDFNKKDYLDWYSNKYESDYLDDWDGFNVPASIFKQVVNDKIFLTEGVGDLSQAELKLAGRAGDYKYVIGFIEGDLETFRHELAHALYYIDPEYHLKANRALIANQESLSDLFDYLTDEGYSEDFLFDEAQAYIVSGFPEGVSLREPLKSTLMKLFNSKMEK